LIPPLIGFFSKQFVLYSAIQNGNYFISIVAILVSVISASYYLRIIKVLFDNSDSPNFQNSLTLNTTQFKINKNIYFNLLFIFCLSSFLNKIFVTTNNTNFNQNVLNFPYSLISDISLAEGSLTTAKQVKSYSETSFFNLSNFHSFLISNLTIIILLFVLKPQIILSSTRLLSLTIFTY
jgi:NADH-ubiquinone oxidoreductase chain 2